MIFETALKLFGHHRSHKNKIAFEMSSNATSHQMVRESYQEYFESKCVGVQSQL